MQHGDEGERDRHGNAVRGDLGEDGRQSGERTFEHVRDRGFADPAQPERREGDPQLGRGNHPVEGLDRPERQHSFAIAVARHLLEPGFPGRDEGEFGRHEERVGGDQSEDDDEPEADGHIPEG